MTLLVAGAAVLDAAGRVLAAERSAPPELAGCWEFPGGKVEPGESEPAAAARECREELGIEIAVGDLLGEAPIPGGLLRVYLARLVAGEPRALEHRALRWLTPAELGDVPWLDPDLPLVAVLRARLSGQSRRPIDG